MLRWWRQQHHSSNCKNRGKLNFCETHLCDDCDLTGMLLVKYFEISWNKNKFFFLNLPFLFSKKKKWKFTLNSGIDFHGASRLEANLLFTIQLVLIKDLEEKDGGNGICRGARLFDDYQIVRFVTPMRALKFLVAACCRESRWGIDLLS